MLAGLSDRCNRTGPGITLVSEAGQSVILPVRIQKAEIAAWRNDAARRHGGPPTGADSRTADSRALTGSFGGQFLFTDRTEISVMEIVYLGLVVFLLGLAVFDLVVGVSNDAVNFLTSAVGSRAGTFRRIMIVASIGILIGASSSGGMMQIAKSGVFQPGQFTFQQVIFIYLCVMLSDILLLDFFNSLKLPTSTTISIVFELLGASIAVSLYSMYQDAVPLTAFGEYINTTKAVQMIVAIFVSVAIAFLAGWLVQFILRAITTFNYKRNVALSRAIFGGNTLVIVMKFIINVGLKNSPLRGTLAVTWLLDHFLIVALAVAVVSALTVFVLS